MAASQRREKELLRENQELKERLLAEGTRRVRAELLLKEQDGYSNKWWKWGLALGPARRPEGVPWDPQWGRQIHRPTKDHFERYGV